jgi:hypothetical protein
LTVLHRSQARSADPREAVATLKTLFKAAGRLRELQLALEMIPDFVEAGRARSIRKYMDELRAERAKSARAVRAEIRRVKAADLARLRTWIHEATAFRTNAELQRACVSWVRKELGRLAKLAEGRQRHRALHTIRRHLKRVHYTLVMLRRGRQRSLPLATFKRIDLLQHALGEWHDIHALRELWIDQVGRHKSGRAVGQALRKRQNELEAAIEPQLISVLHPSRERD